MTEHQKDVWAACFWLASWRRYARGLDRAEMAAGVKQPR